MQIDLCNKLIDKDLTREELLEKVKIEKTNDNDLSKICSTLSKAFDLKGGELEALFQMEHSNALLNESVKLVDKDNGDIYGLLIFCEYPIKFGSPIDFENKELSKYLDNFKQVNGHSFIIDERLRNCGFDKEMLKFNLEFLFKNYDFIWIGIEESLRSFSYWQRLGFIELFKIKEATFYLLPLSKKMVDDIYKEREEQ